MARRAWGNRLLQLLSVRLRWALEQFQGVCRRVGKEPQISGWRSWKGCRRELLCFRESTEKGEMK